MVSVKTITTIIILWLLGYITVLALDIIYILSCFLCLQPWLNLLEDTIKVTISAQGVISEAVSAFVEAEGTRNFLIFTLDYKSFLLMIIVGCSWLTILIIRFIYNKIKWFIPSTEIRLRDKLLVLIIAVGIFYFASLGYSIIIGRGPILPFQGWIDLYKNSNTIMEYLLEKYSQTPIEELS